MDGLRQPMHLHPKASRRHHLCRLLPGLGLRDGCVVLGLVLRFFGVGGFGVHCLSLCVFLFGGGSKGSQKEDTHFGAFHNENWKTSCRDKGSSERIGSAASCTQAIHGIIGLVSTWDWNRPNGAVSFCYPFKSTPLNNKAHSFLNLLQLDCGRHVPAQSAATR